MTRIDTRRRERPVWHETALVDTHSGRHYVVAETPANLLMRLKGTRQTLSLPWNIAYLRAATLAADMNRIERKNRRRSVTRGSL